MTVVLVDARYYGDIMRQTRKWLKIDSDTAAKILKIGRKEYRKYERGRAVMPREIYNFRGRQAGGGWGNHE